MCLSRCRRGVVRGVAEGLNREELSKVPGTGHGGVPWEWKEGWGIVLAVGLERFPVVDGKGRRCMGGRVGGGTLWRGRVGGGQRGLGGRETQET